MTRFSLPFLSRTSASRAVLAWRSLRCIAACLPPLVACIGVIGCRSSNECGQYADAVKWAVQQGSDHGDTPFEVTLPDNLRHHSVDGRATIVRGDGRTCVLLKTSIGYKGNFEGVVCSSAPIRDQELSANGTILTVNSAPPFEELHVRRRCSDSCFQVFFDLN